MTRPRPTPARRARYRKPGIRAKIYVAADMIGSGKIDLLKAVARTGSISAAAKSMGLGYHRAWFLLRTIQSCFEAPLYVSSRGGAGPAGTRLTPLGEELIRRYDANVVDIERASAGFLGWLETHQRRGDER